jgi:hypothetical protein
MTELADSPLTGHLTRRRLLTGGAGLAAGGLATFALADPAEAAGKKYSRSTTLWFGPTKNFRYTPIRLWWIRSSSGASRHFYKAEVGTATGNGNDILIYCVHIWQSYDPFGPAVRQSYILYPNRGLGAYGATTAVQPSSRMPYIANKDRLHLNIELTDWWNNKGHRQCRITATGATWDAK